MDRVVNESIRRQAQRNHSAILRGLAQVTQSCVADLIGASEATVSRFKEMGLEQAAALLAACGLKVVPESAQVLDAEYIKALKTMAGVGLGHEPKSSEWGDL